MLACAALGGRRLLLCREVLLLHRLFGASHLPFVRGRSTDLGPDGAGKEHRFGRGVRDPQSGPGGVDMSLPRRLGQFLADLCQD